MKAFKVSVTTTATLIVAADIEKRTIYLHNDSGGSIYLGGSDVTTTVGYHFKNQETLALDIPQGETLYGITATNTHDISVLRSSDA